MNDFLPYHVVDLFAGPGGLAEGFASLEADGVRPFRIALSVEKDTTAHGTLRFRAFLRQFVGGYPDRYYEFLNDGIEEPDWADEFPSEWAAAEEEALLLELGKAGATERLEPLVDKLRDGAAGRTVVIGGPPCQAYSIVGRARNKGKVGYTPATDERHFLYREYIAILERIRPAAFVMENVKGILSSSVDGQAIFAQVLADLQAIGGEEQAYELLALARGGDGVVRLVATLEPKDFIICAEDFGIPQARHRVIIIGVRRDAVSSDRLFRIGKADALATDDVKALVKATVRHVLVGLPELRSGLSKNDSLEGWSRSLRLAIETVTAATKGEDHMLQKVHKEVEVLRIRWLRGDYPRMRSGDAVGDLHAECPPELRSWLLDPRLRRITGHSSRSHMDSDLARYLFVSAFAQAHGRSPVAKEFPTLLAPAHKNWDSGHFADRFRAQIWDEPSRTITSHIAKDGHYFIHPDPAQCRALTVREAARLQTFPDNYKFLGNRTQQFVQVGNAVPPLLARQIAQALFGLFSSTTAELDEIPMLGGRQGELAFDGPNKVDADRLAEVLAFGSVEPATKSEGARTQAEQLGGRVPLRLKTYRGSRSMRLATRRARRR